MLCKLEDLSLIFRAYIQKPGRPACACDPSTGEEDSLLPNLADLVSFRTAETSSENKWGKKIAQ